MERCKVMLAVRTSKEKRKWKWLADQGWRAEMSTQLEPLQAFMVWEGQASTPVLILH